MWVETLMFYFLVKKGRFFFSCKFLLLRMSLRLISDLRFCKVKDFNWRVFFLIILIHVLRQSKVFSTHSRNTLGQKSVCIFLFHGCISESFISPKTSSFLRLKQFENPLLIIFINQNFIVEKTIRIRFLHFCLFIICLYP